VGSFFKIEATLITVPGRNKGGPKLRKIVPFVADGSRWSWLFGHENLVQQGKIMELNHRLRAVGGEIAP